MLTGYFSKDALGAQLYPAEDTPAPSRGNIDDAPFIVMFTGAKAQESEQEIIDSTGAFRAACIYEHKVYSGPPFQPHEPPTLTRHTPLRDPLRVWGYYDDGTTPETPPPPLCLLDWEHRLSPLTHPAEHERDAREARAIIDKRADIACWGLIRGSYEWHTAENRRAHQEKNNIITRDTLRHFDRVSMSLYIKTDQPASWAEWHRHNADELARCAARHRRDTGRKRKPIAWVSLHTPEMGLWGRSAHGGPDDWVLRLQLGACERADAVPVLWSHAFNTAQAYDHLARVLDSIRSGALGEYLERRGYPVAS